jgi:hypothetical protein
MELAIGEYHRELAWYDDSRESSVISAFVARVQSDVAEPSALESHAAEFTEALRRIRTDREMEWRRHATAKENVLALREVSRGLQRLAIESLVFEDEMQRYLTSWLDARRRAKETTVEVASEASPVN